MDDLINQVKQAYKELKKMADDAGINKKSIQEEEEIPSMRLIHDRLIELGQSIGSYRKALNIYYENCIIDEIDALELRGTHFYDLLFEELRRDNYFNKENDESMTWDLKIL